MGNATEKFGMVDEISEISSYNLVPRAFPLKNGKGKALGTRLIKLFILTAQTALVRVVTPRNFIESII